MITELIVDLLLDIVDNVMTWLPVLAIPTDFLSGIGGIIELLAVGSYFMPIGTLQLAIIVFVAFHSMEFIISVVNWLIGKIPTID